jgi:hypothetical protein
LEYIGLPCSSDGIATYYEEVIDGLVADQSTDRAPVLETDVLMATPEARSAVAEKALGFALSRR